MRRREGEGLRKAGSEIWTVSLYEIFFAGWVWLRYEQESNGRSERDIFYERKEWLCLI